MKAGRKRKCFLIYIVLLVLLAVSAFPVRAAQPEESVTAGSSVARPSVQEAQAEESVTASSSVPEAQAEERVTARPSVNGRLRVDGVQLTDAQGRPVQLRGVSTHGLTWFPEYINQTLFEQISADWDCNLIRLPMYSQVYCEGEEESSLSLLKQGIEAAAAADMYVIVDWHILEDNDPNQHIEEAMAFFDQIASEYADLPNLLFEICNEPNGPLVSWPDVMTYSNQVIPVIRRHIPDAVILVGTPDYSRDLGSAVIRPLDFENVMYVLHFYAASHKEGLLGELKAAREHGLPVFVSESGISESSGDGTLDFASAAEWYRYLNEQQISYTVWNLSDKNETSSFLQPDVQPDAILTDQDLTAAGLWVRELIRGTDPREIPVPAPVLEKSFGSRVRSWIITSLGQRGTTGLSRWTAFAGLALLAAALFFLLVMLYRKLTRRKHPAYDDIFRDGSTKERHIIKGKRRVITGILLIVSILFTLIYLCWRVGCSIPVEAGVLAIAANIILLLVEILGFMESLVLFRNLLGLKKYKLPDIPEDAWPEVDIFISTYNEPTELLRRTINGCTHMKYPDPSKVHIWLCDDNRRPAMRALAEEMGVGYFDRPDNKGAKAGNLNQALARTGAPYIVTFDADMIPKSDFLLKTIPYFVDAELKNQDLPEEEHIHLGLLQTPQCFYDPDVFQHALYSEKRVPNEQDFFYRTIEPARTSTNSVIYGGSNTVLSRRALEDIGGFYTESITEDFATGLLIESRGYVSLALPEPLASGQTPHTYREHIQQRTRWGRGVIVTARKLRIWRRPGLNLAQRLSYWSSVAYWYSPVKNLVYILSPLLFAVFALPVFQCNWLELLVFWAPMFILQNSSLILSSRRTISNRWTGIYETSVMPHLLIPIIKESLGISLTAFKVTDKSGTAGRRSRDIRAMLPFLVLSLLSLAGIVRIIVIFDSMQVISLVILLFWLVRNLYYLILALFLVDGRDSDLEPVKVVDAVPVIVEREQGERALYEGITTRLTEHNVTVFLDEGETLGIGASVSLCLDNGDHRARVKGVVTEIQEARRSRTFIQTIEILDFGTDQYEYWELLYDRIPTLPQSLHHDFSLIGHLWQNIVHRVARYRK